MILNDAKLCQYCIETLQQLGQSTIKQKCNLRSKVVAM